MIEAWSEITLPTAIGVCFERKPSTADCTISALLISTFFVHSNGDDDDDDE